MIIQKKNKTHIVVGGIQYKSIKTIYDYLLDKFKNKLTIKINKDDLLQVKFDSIDGEGPVYNKLYYTSDQKIIQIIKELENYQDKIIYYNNEDNHDFYKNKNKDNFIFVNIKNEFIKYIKINIDIDCFEDSITKIKLPSDGWRIKDNGDYYECSSYVYVILDLNKYYQDLILSELTQEEMKNKFINKKEDFIEIYFY